ncbi:M48 family metallopeptidase [Streptomyces sp. NPDC101150]|uniref:M48 family metallopeptidase n=1 Tax=Streptomyces sp. NPDC101150 TaxID=3366114 RepID=UPI003812FAE6
MEKCFAYLSPLRSVVLVAFAVVLIVIVFALLLYACIPAWRIRRRRLVAVSVLNSPALEAELNELRQQAGIARVTFLMDPLDPRVSGLAFGLPRRRYVSLSRGLVHCRSTDPALFRAVVLHELGHVRNKDIDAAYLAVAIWRVFAVLVLTPAFLLAMASGPSDWIFVGGRLVFLALVVLLIRNGVLRSRELHADARVAQWGMSGPLQRALEAHRDVRRGFLSGLRRTHPDPIRRRAALRDTDMLVQVSWWDGTALGITTTIAYNTTVLVFDWLFPTGSYPALLPVFLFILPAAGGVAIAGFRANLTAVTRAKRPRVDGFALGLGTGFAIGVGLATQAGFLTPDKPYPSFPGLDLLGWLACVSLIIGATWLQVRWLVATLKLWMPYVVTLRSPARPVFAAAALAAFSLALWLPYLLDLPNYANLTKIDVLPEYSSAEVVLGLAALPVVLTLPLTAVLGALTALWVLPFMAALPHFPRRSHPVRPWVAFDPLPHGWRPPDALVGPARALYTGLAATSAALTAAVGCYALAVTSHEISPNSLNSISQLLNFLPFLLGALAVVAAALISTAQAQELRALHGLLAAFVPGLPVIFGGDLIQSTALCLIGRCTRPDLDNSWDLFRWFARWTLPASLVLSALLAALLALRARRDPRGSPTRPSGAAGKRR